MSARLFLGYFVALAACATIAFASSEGGSAAATDSVDAERAYAELPLPPAAFHARPHKSLPNKALPGPVRFALAQ